MKKRTLEYIFPKELTAQERKQYFDFLALFGKELPKECLMQFQCNKELLIPVSGYIAFQNFCKLNRIIPPPSLES